MHRFMTVLTLTAVAILITLPAAAADNGFYLGLSAGQAEISSEDYGDFEFEGDDIGYKVFAGYRFLTFLAVEAATSTSALRRTTSRTCATRST